MSWFKEELDAAETAVSNLFTKLKTNPEVEKVEEKAAAIEHAAVEYIKSNGLHDFYQICISVLTGAVFGTPWAILATTALKEAENAGIAIAKGAESLVLAQAQADLLATGVIAAPSTGAVVGDSAADQPAA